MATMQLGRTIKQARLRAKMSQRQLALAMGLTAKERSWVASVETAAIAKPDRDRLARLAPILGLDLDRLLTLSDQLGAALEVREQQRTPADGTAALVAAISAQTEAISALVAELRASRAEESEQVRRIWSPEGQAVVVSAAVRVLEARLAESAAARPRS